jgi:hypothetical protein
LKKDPLIHKQWGLGLRLRLHYFYSPIALKDKMRIKGD